MNSNRTPAQHRLRLGVLLLLAAACSGQAAQSRRDRIDWLRQHTIELRTTDPAARDDSDLRALQRVIADARVVQLGEQTHGDGTSFLLRARLIRFLHEHMGFDVLTFETGFYESRDVRAALADPTVSLHEAIGAGVYPIWAESRQIDPLFQIIRRSLVTTSPIHFAGFDVQFSRPGTEQRLADDLIALFAHAEETALSEVQCQRLRTLVRAIAGKGQYDIEPADHERYIRLLTDLEQRLTDQTSRLHRRFSGHELAWWGRIVGGLSRMENNVRLETLAPPITISNVDEATRAPQRIMGAAQRDQGMAENLLWLLHESLPGRKVVVWAANNHVSHRSARRASSPMPGESEPPEHIPAGQHLRAALGDDVYTVLTVPYQGRWAAPSIRTAEGELRWQEGRYEPATEGSLAAMLHETGFELGLLDLRQVRDRPGHWLNQPLILRQDILGGEPVVLPDYCDAVLFIDRMSPSEPRSSAPQ